MHHLTIEQWNSLPEPVQRQWELETSLGAPSEELKRIMRFCLLPDVVERPQGWSWVQ